MFDKGRYCKVKAIGIVLAGGNNERMRELSNKRAIAAMPIAGSYRSIDFALSSMSNSHIHKVAVITQFNSRILNEHLSSSKWWDFGRKQGGLYIFAPTITMDNGFWYRGTADAIFQNINFLKSTHEPYVVIASADGVYKLDFNQVIEYHIKKNADITIVTKTLDILENPRRFGFVTLNEEARITEFDEKPLDSNSSLVSTGIYVMRRRLLIELLEEASKDNKYDFVHDIILKYKDRKRIYAYEMREYWRNIASVNAYYQTNMDFLNKEIRNYFFKQYPEVYSKIDDLPPAKYNIGAEVKNSLVSSGCIINGTVENSILFKNVYVGNHCTIKNSIILNDVHIGDNTYIENCIVESCDTIMANTSHVGVEGNVKIVIEKNDRISNMTFLT